MEGQGLSEVPNPSALFLTHRGEPVSGTSVFPAIEGSRPVLVEIQALVAPSPYGTPRRAVVGWDGNRLAMITAVLDARCGLSIGPNDIYLNVAGGLRIAEPAADLAVAAALISALTGRPVPPETVVFGEIGLSGEVRAVSQTDARLKEAGKLGFTSALIPPRRAGGKARRVPENGILASEISQLRQLVELFEDAAPAGKTAAARRRVEA
jgi:DNA repair protein RadA/Sms